MFSFNASTLNRQTNIAGVLSLLGYAYLASQSQYYGDAQLWQLLSVSAFCFACSVFVWWQYTQNKQQVPILLLLSYAILFRLIGLFAFPILEDDMYRYLWDAKHTIEQGSPYNIPPSAYFDAEHLSERFEHILSGINYPDIATVYGPLCQWAFALAYLIAPGEIWPLQLLFGGADILLILALLKLGKPTHVLLYAWSPLIIKEFAFTAHPDVLGAMFMLFALCAYQNKKPIWIGVFMGLAAGVKVFAIILLPFLLLLHWRGWLAFLATIIAIALPFGLRDAWLPAGLVAMGNDWLFNAPLYTLYAVITNNIDSLPIFKLVLLALLALCAGSYLLWHAYRAIYQQQQDQIYGDLLFAGLFLCIPALNPWYLVWLLPFAALRPSLWAWVTSISILLSYASGINLPSSTTLGPYQHSVWLLLFEFSLIGGAVIIDVYLRKKRKT